MSLSKRREVGWFTHGLRVQRGLQRTKKGGQLEASGASRWAGKVCRELLSYLLKTIASFFDQDTARVLYVLVFARELGDLSVYSQNAKAALQGSQQELGDVDGVPGASLASSLYVCSMDVGCGE